MKKPFLLIFLSIYFGISTYSQITQTKTEGNSVVTKLSMGIKVNEGSSLIREKVTINDAQCPIQLSNIGVQPVYSSSRSDYTFYPEGIFNTIELIVAIEIYHVIYDVFCEYMRTLSNT